MERRYDPDKPPRPEEWTALDEGEQLDLVQQYHRKKRVRLPNARLHALIHVVVENQVTLGDRIPVRSTLLRLIREGLSRHDAVHAIGTVLARQFFDLMKDKPKDSDLGARYYGELDQLTAEGWLSSFNDEGEE